MMVIERGFGPEISGIAYQKGRIFVTGCLSGRNQQMCCALAPVPRCGV